MSSEARKYQLIEGIMQVSDESIISKFEQLLKAYVKDKESIKYLITPPRKKLDLDQLIKEQNFKGVDKEKIDRLIDEMAITEPIEDLLEMI